MQQMYAVRLLLVCLVGDAIACLFRIACSFVHESELCVMLLGADFPALKYVVLLSARRRTVETYLHLHFPWFGDDEQRLSVHAVMIIHQNLCQHQCVGIEFEHTVFDFDGIHMRCILWTIVGNEEDSHSFQIAFGDFACDVACFG